MNRAIAVFVSSAFVLMLVLAGCSKKEEDKAASRDVGEESTVVAKVGNNAMTVSDFRRYLADRPTPYPSRVSKEDLEKRLDDMVLQEVLVQEAVRLGLDRDPDVKQRIRQMLSQKLIDEQVKRKVWNREIEEKELQEYYDRHWDVFNRPEQVRLADIFIAVPVDATDEEKGALRKRAETALMDALASRDKRNGFGMLVKIYSDQHKKYKKGDTGFFDREGKPAGIDKRVAEEAFRLERVGSMAEHAIETPDGYHAIMLIGKRSAYQRPLESVREEMTQRIRRESVADARQKLISGLKEKALIEIDSQSMERVLAELNQKNQPRQASSKISKRPAMGGSASSPPKLPGTK